MGITAGGGHAERLVVHQDQAVRVPQGMDLAMAGALPEVFITAWDALVLQGGLSAGGTALVHAGASGVGTAAIQLCRMAGAEVLVTASAGKVDRCLSLGAARAVDYASEDWVAAVADHTAGRGVDVVLDVVGADYLDRNLDALAVGGTIVQVGVMGGGSATFGLGKMLFRRATLVGTTLRARSLDEKVSVSRAFEDRVVPGFEDGRLEVVVDRRYPLDDIAEAHAYMETNASVGKIALDVAAS
jgi:NADPH:quinone reductase-like Zn-dependent oxidoreductase